jgi:hypothetical protein
MEPQDAATFVDQQIGLNRKINKTLNGFVEAIEIQSRFNKEASEYLERQDSRIDNLNRVVVALTTFLVVTMLGVLILVVRINS